MILVEYHYDNSRLQEGQKNGFLKKMIPFIKFLNNFAGRVDSSGVRFYFSKNLRKNELGVVVINSFQRPLSSVLPPQSDNLTLTSICYPECTDVIRKNLFFIYLLLQLTFRYFFLQRFFPKDGINVIAGILHTHLAGI